MTTIQSPALSLDPAEASDRLRQAMRRVAQTVTILTTRVGDQRFGITASAFTTVSMDPPSVMVAVNNQASLSGPLQERRAFAVNVLGEDQRAVAEAFADRSLTLDERFAVGAWEDHPANLPICREALAVLVCSADHATRYGTHTVTIGRVEDVLLSGEDRPLVWLNGAFGGR